MLRLERHIIFKVFMAMCVAMQAFVVLPHHHHGQSEALCINFMHCVADEHGHNCDDGAMAVCEHEGSHQHDACDNCLVSHFDAMRPAEDQQRINIAVLGSGLFSVFTVGAEDDFCGRCHIHAVGSDISQYTGVPPRHIAYIADALPVRAPSFTV